MKPSKALAYACLFFFPSLAAGQGSDWPRFLGPLGTSVSTEKGIVTPWPKAGPKIVWHKEVGPGYGMPTIAKGRLYHFDRVPKKPDDFQDSKFVRLTCMNAKTGERIWDFEYPSIYKDAFGYNNGPRCSPILDGDHVYTYGVEGMIHCLKADTGKLVWKINANKEFNVIQNFFGVGSTPVIEGNLLIAQVGGSPPGSLQRNLFDQTLKSNGSAVVAFDKLTGKVAYKIGNDLASYSSPVLATIHKRRYCFVFARGGLLAFEPNTGKIDFRFPFRSEDVESVNAANPVVLGDQVFISECYGPGSALLKIKPGGYEVLREESKKFKKSMAIHWMTPIVQEGFLYGCSGRHTAGADLRCIDFATGKVMWSEPRLTRSSLLMVDGHFICLCEDGTLRLLKVNPKKFDEVSSVELKDPKTDKALLQYPCWAAPILSHGLLYVRGEERLVCLELISQKK
ncbi:MAG: PQQ-binding-like beta-propeller repeat protein [Planctomycetes bacterium]|nr:PQQ-binding-like beta-propeller repeat protein [Planctomycetota bacterium]